MNPKDKIKRMLRMPRMNGKSRVVNNVTGTVNNVLNSNKPIFGTPSMRRLHRRPGQMQTGSKKGLDDPDEYREGMSVGLMRYLSNQRRAREAAEDEYQEGIQAESDKLSVCPRCKHSAFDHIEEKDKTIKCKRCGCTYYDEV